MPLAGAALLDAVTDAIVALHFYHHRRVPVTARTQMFGDDVLTCTVGGIFSADAPGDTDEVHEPVAARENHIRYQQITRSACIELVQRLTGRQVELYMSHLHVGPDHVVELFRLAPRRLTNTSSALADSSPQMVADRNTSPTSFPDTPCQCGTSSAMR